MPDQRQENPAISALTNLRNRLLDLTARNRLINFSHAKGSSLRVIDELPDRLFEDLIAEKEMRFLPIPEPKKEQLIEAGYIKIEEDTGKVTRLKKDPTAEEWARWRGFDTSYEMPAPSNEMPPKKHSDKAIQTMLFPAELEGRLRGLRQKAQSAIDETGANILYMALGFLEWFDSPNGKNGRLAPLCLLPCRLEKGQLNPTNKAYEYTLRYSGEDIMTNLSLKEKLRLDFGLELPEFFEESSPESYFDETLKLIRANDLDWRVRRYATLALLNFSQLLMYLDLDPARWPKDQQITEHAAIKTLLSGSDSEKDENDSSSEFSAEYFVDDLPNVHESYPLIDDADSSQHSALIDAVKGRNLVIEGPPGTGKSQTITNLVAATMAQGKTVLFVAEKLAALEVVKRRLDDAGLGDFCLELHSHKSQKRKVLDEVRARLNNRGRYRSLSQIEADINHYESLKTTLKNHAERINRKWKNTEKTPHQIFTAATRYRETLDMNFGFCKIYDGRSFTPAEQHRASDQVKAYEQVGQAVVEQLPDQGMLQNHPWYGVTTTELQYFDLDRVTRVLQDWQLSLEELVKIRSEYKAVLDANHSEIPNTIEGLAALKSDLTRLPKLEGDEFLECLPNLQDTSLDEAEEYLKQFDEIQSKYVSLANRVGESVLTNFSKLDEFLACGQQLQQTLDGSFKFIDLQQVLRLLHILEEQLSKLSVPLLKIREKIGQEACLHLQLSVAGLTNLKLYVETVASLQPQHRRMRNRLFDNDELDQLLPQIGEELRSLRASEKELSKTYSVDSLRDPSKLEGLGVVIENGGLFRWFKSEWRAARKDLLSLRANRQVSFAEVVGSLQGAAEFAERRRRFEENLTYMELLGEYFKGMDTELATLENIRGWYRSVRNSYGLAFGSKAALGDSILDMEDKFAEAIRSLSEQGFVERIDHALKQINGLRAKIRPGTDLQSDTDLLLGEDGSITRLSRILTEATYSAEPLVGDGTTTISEFVQLVQQLDSLRQVVAKWSELDTDHRLFDSNLCLRIGLSADNAEALAAAQRTLNVAKCIDREIKTPSLRAQILSNPEKNTFDRLLAVSDKLATALDGQAQRYSTFEELVSLKWSDWTRTCGEDLSELLSRNSQALSSGRALHNWLDYVRERKRLSDMRLEYLAEWLESGDIRLDQLVTAYFASTYDCLSREILDEQPELGRFSGPQHDSVRSQFRECDKKLKELQRKRIAWLIDQKEVPCGNGKGLVSEYTEKALVEHECGKKTRHLPIRQLLKRAGRALLSLKPCFMMGPMSVAQYLEPGQIGFDLVVMDEASQIKPQDALGSVARGAQVVVVGDPKQLPPTRFFDKILTDEDEDPAAIEESESILDAAQRPFFQKRRLLWHYRSQHESLIAFSNHSFYGGDLVLFPSPHSDSCRYGIKHHSLPDGYFRNRRNFEEAKAIAKYTREHFIECFDESLGIVAMSAEQRDQIEREMETLAKEDEVFRELLEKDQRRKDSLFIKNLENVQGDERDVIFISMTYGPSEPGSRVPQRFGPINSDVGWRRLNVLFTRSRKRMHVFSSMTAEDILVGSAKSRGVIALRGFLKYCETGLLHEFSGNVGGPPDSDFEIAVAEKLSSAGFDCVPQLGVAKFFIDIAVKDPGNPGRYLMGVECDGARYHSAKSVRDRDRLRQEILERLGWRIRRVWSTDWFKNPDAELRPILRELRELATPEHRDAIDEIQSIEQPEDYNFQVNDWISRNGDLKQRLMDFDVEVIRKELPGTPDNRRLLRPEMMEALLEYQPMDKTEFLERIPPYLRHSTEASEGRFLQRVLDIVGSAASDEKQV